MYLLFYSPLLYDLGRRPRPLIIQVADIFASNFFGSLPVKIIPVLDILEGVVVRGIAGRRDQYRPILSCLTTEIEPLAVAEAIRNSFGLNELYVADLDGIQAHQPNLEIYQRLHEAGFQLLIDPGIRTVTDVQLLHDAGLSDLIVGLESCASLLELNRMIQKSPRITFSLDLLRDAVRRQNETTGFSDQPKEIIRQVVQAGVTSILPLDLADVGMGTGGSTDLICRFIREVFPNVRVLAGGGVRNSQDLLRLKQLGVDAVLVASALHDGRLDRKALNEIQTDA